ncbi:olfactomedin-4-like [Bufo gargarizans]|uniref:olfactomedin-4-like n=1 Tax=Bufo gargarizans TaxID=30331 RepID=UPI001CF0E359|nr:olfactomedin-4-like [Bufo gargarizans]
MGVTQGTWIYLVCQNFLIELYKMQSNDAESHGEYKYKMKTIILILWSLGLCLAQSTYPGFSPPKEKVVSGSMDEQGVCHCSLAISDLFSTEQTEFLETSNLNLGRRFQEEIDKIQDYKHKVDIYLKIIRNLTRRVAFCDEEDNSFSQLDFEMLKFEISELDALVKELKSSLTGSNEKVEALYMEILNISAMENQPERHDKNDIIDFRKQTASLQKRLDERRKRQSPFHVQFGTCEHGGIMNISKPQVVQINRRGASYVTGGWGKDTFLGSAQELYWELSNNISSYTTVRFYPTYKDLKQYKNYKDQTLSVTGRGNDLTLYDNSLYYNCYSTDICKFNLDTNKVDHKTLSNAAHGFSYSKSQYQDLDLEGDENGLWVLYSKQDVQGNIVIGMLNETSLELIKTWVTSVYRPNVTNAFMVCGVMHATRTLNTREEEIFYMFDTNTSEERFLKIPFEKMLDNIQSLSYNANDHKLYMYNKGFEVIYDVNFKPLA